MTSHTRGSRKSKRKEVEKEPNAWFQARKRHINRVHTKGVMQPHASFLEGFLEGSLTISAFLEDS